MFNDARFFPRFQQGGHILFGLYELFTRRKPSDRFMQAAQIIGMFILLALMVLAFGNDIGRLIR